MEKKPVYKNYSEKINGREYQFRTVVYNQDYPYVLYLDTCSDLKNLHTGKERIITESLNFRANVIHLPVKICGKNVSMEDNYLKLVFDINNVLNHLGVGKIIIMGQGFGGVCAAKYAALNSQRIYSVITVDPLVSWKDMLEKFYQESFFYNQKYTRMFYRLMGNIEMDRMSKSELKSFCRLMWKFHSNVDGGKSGSFYQKCISAPQLLTKKEIRFVLRELKNDRDILVQFYGGKDRWIGWIKEGIQYKYGLHEKSSGIKKFLREYKMRGADWGGVKKAIADIGMIKADFYYLYAKGDLLTRSDKLAKWVTENAGPKYVVEFEQSSSRSLHEKHASFGSVFQKIYSSYQSD